MRPSRPMATLVVGMVGVGVSLRTLMACLPPLVGRIQSDLGLSALWIGVLTTLPVLCMGLFAPPAARLGHRWGSARTVTLAMVLVIVGNLARGLGDHLSALYLGTLSAGIGIAVIGTLLPGLVKTLFPPERAGVATGLQMFAMMGGAGVASALAVPLEGRLGSWPASLGVWGLVAAGGLVLWLPVDRAAHRHVVADAHPDEPARGLPWRSLTAWLTAAYLTFQSWQFYSSLAWLAPTYVAEGWPAADAGYLLSVFAASQLVSGLVAPALTDRVGDWRVLLVVAGLLGLAGECGVWLAPTAAPWVWALLLGAGQGSAFALGLVLLVRYAGTPRASARLTAMGFLVSYAIASLGPTTMGAVHDVSGGFRAVWLILGLVMLPQLAVAVVLRPGRTPVT